MRYRILFVIAMLAVPSIQCGGDDGTGALSHPKLDQDYSSRFAGLWNGSATISTAGQPSETASGIQQIERVDFNRLSLAEMCPGAPAAAAGIDSATTFSMDPLTCKPINQTCGPVTIRYDRGTGTLAQNTLTIALEGTGSGCGKDG
jgi:hypothetical protein